MILQFNLFTYFCHSTRDRYYEGGRLGGGSNLILKSCQPRRVISGGRGQKRERYCHSKSTVSLTGT